MQEIAQGEEVFIMGLPAARLGDIGSGHSCHYPPSPAVEGSPNVIINGRPAMRKGDAYEQPRLILWITSMIE